MIRNLRTQSSHFVKTNAFQRHTSIAWAQIVRRWSMDRHKVLPMSNEQSPGKLGRLDLSLLEIFDHRTARLALAVCTRCPALELITGQPPLGRVVFMICITLSVLWCELNSLHCWQVLFLIELWHCMTVKSGLFQLRNTATPHHRCPIPRIRVSA